MTTIDAGNYTAKATRWAWDTAKDGGMCLALVFEITEGDAAGAQIDGRLYFDTDRADANNRTAADRSMEALRAMGLRGGMESITDEGGGGLDAGTVHLVVEINAKGYPTVKYINAPRGGRELRTFSPPGAQAKQTFFAQMNARLRAAEQGARASGTAPTRPAPQRAPAPRQAPRGFDAGEGEDSIPF